MARKPTRRSRKSSAAVAPAPPKPAPRFRQLIFDERPLQDTTWSITTGRDGAVYVALCGEFTGGLSCYLARYDPASDRKEYLVDVAHALGEPPDNGRATQSKIHYCMIPDDEGVLWCATHCTGPPIGDPVWSPWNCWMHPEKGFTGFHIFAYDPARGDFRDFGVKGVCEGSRAMAMDRRRRKLYGVTYPRNHFYVYYMDQDRCLDLGRFGDINPQAVWVDSAGNGYTVDDLGYIVRCDADTDELEQLDVRIPHAPFRDGTYNTVYDVAPAPDGHSIYGVSWSYDMRLFRYDMSHPRSPASMQDLGRAYGPEYEDWDNFDHANHAGGMVFGDDGKLYFCASVWWKEPQGMYLVRLDPQTLEREELGPITDGVDSSTYIAKATKDFDGVLYFADCCKTPTRTWQYRPDVLASRTGKQRWAELRPWG
jgi:hypothetical protein